jgi:hypothetical protein
MKMCMVYPNSEKNKKVHEKINSFKLNSTINITKNIYAKIFT